MKRATLDRPTESTPAAAGVETMRSIVQDEYGSAPEDVLRLADVARPTIADDEILVHVRAASVDPGTWHVMAGLPYPIRAGTDRAGHRSDVPPERRPGGHPAPDRRSRPRQGGHHRVRAEPSPRAMTFRRSRRQTG